MKMQSEILYGFSKILLDTNAVFFFRVCFKTVHWSAVCSNVYSQIIWKLCPVLGSSLEKDYTAVVEHWSTWDGGNWVGSVWPGGENVEADLIALCSHLIGRCREGGAMLFSEVHSNRTRGIREVAVLVIS